MKKMKTTKVIKRKPINLATKPTRKRINLDKKPIDSAKIAEKFDQTMEKLADKPATKLGKPSNDSTFVAGIPGYYHTTSR